MAEHGNIWVIDDDRSIRWVLEKAFSKAGIDVRTFENGNKVLDALGEGQPDAILSDIRMPGIDGIALLEEISKQLPDLPVIIMTAHSDLDSALQAYEGGAFEYLPKPFDVKEAVTLVERAIRQSKEKQKQHTNVSDEELPEIIGEAPAMQEVFRAIGRLSRSNVTVMINGESGTGKELVAQALHKHSPRAANTFIALNMAAIPRDLMESELFGHERGAFTGAQSQRQGRFEQANGGTLFLDEIGDMPPELQTRLLRVLADGEFYRVGGHTPIKVDVRIIAATHQDLEQRVTDGQFREDLFHRLNVIRIHLPALRERREDIPKLAEHFLVQTAKELSVEVKVLNDDVMEYLQSLPWPGNVRQLQNTCHWLTVMASGRDIHMEDLPPELLQKSEQVAGQAEGWESSLQQWADNKLAQGEQGILDKAAPVFERILLQAALNHTGGRKQEAAKLLGWGRNTLTRKLKELGLDAYIRNKAEELV